MLIITAIIVKKNTSYLNRNLFLALHQLFDPLSLGHRCEIED